MIIVPRGGNEPRSASFAAIYGKSPAGHFSVFETRGFP